MMKSDELQPVELMAQRSLANPMHILWRPPGSTFAVNTERIEAEAHVSTTCRVATYFPWWILDVVRLSLVSSDASARLKSPNTSGQRQWPPSRAHPLHLRWRRTRSCRLTSWGAEVDGSPCQWHSRTVVYTSVSFQNLRTQQKQWNQKAGDSNITQPQYLWPSGMPKRCSCLSSPSKPSHTTHLELTWQICLKCRNLQHHRPGWHANMTSHSMSQQVLPIWGPCTAWPVPPPVATCEWDSCETCDPHGEKGIAACLNHHRLLEDKRWEENPKNIEEKGANQQQTTDLVRVGKKAMSNFEKLKQLGNTGSWASWVILFFRTWNNEHKWIMNIVSTATQPWGLASVRFSAKSRERLLRWCLGTANLRIPPMKLAEKEFASPEHALFKFLALLDDIGCHSHRCEVPWGFHQLSRCFAKSEN